MSYISDVLYKNSDGAYKAYAKNMSGYKQATYAYQEKEPNVVSDYNDPTQLNSVADILFNQPALNNMSANYATRIPIVDDILGGLFSLLNKYDTPNQVDLADVAQMIVAPVQLLRTTVIDPIVYKAANETGLQRLSGFKDMSLNALMNLGETLDIVANPIKGALLEQQGPLKGITRSLGLSGEGKYNYDFNTGNIISDIALEIISDPLNWLSFGAGAIADGIAKGAQKTALKTFVQNADELAQTATVLAKNAALYTSTPALALQPVRNMLVDRLASKAWKYGAGVPKDPFDYNTKWQTPDATNIQRYITGHSPGLKDVSPADNAFADVVRMNTVSAKLPEISEALIKAGDNAPYELDNLLWKHVGMGRKDYFNKILDDALEMPDIFLGHYYEIEKFYRRFGIDLPGMKTINNAPITEEVVQNYANAFNDIVPFERSAFFDRVKNDTGSSLFDKVNTDDRMYFVSKKTKTQEFIETAKHYDTFLSELPTADVIAYGKKYSALRPDDFPLNKAVKNMRRINNQLNLMQQIAQDPELGKFQVPIVDNLITMGTQYADDLSAGKFADRISESVDTRYISADQIESLKLDVIFADEDVSKGFEQWIADNKIDMTGIHPHTPNYDNKRVRYIAETRPELLPIRDKVRNAVVLDIETTGLEQGASVLSVGYDIPGKPDRILKLKQDERIVLPNDLLELLIHAPETLTDAEAIAYRKKIYNDEYIKGGLKFSEAMETMYNDLRDVPTNTMVTYNGKRFDIPRLIRALNTRLKEDSLPNAALYIENLKRFEHIDIIRELYKANGTTLMSDRAVASLESLLRNYLNRNVSMKEVKLFDTDYYTSSNFSHPFIGAIKDSVPKAGSPNRVQELKELKVLKDIDAKYAKAYQRLNVRLTSAKENVTQYRIMQTKDGTFVDKSGVVVADDISNVTQLFHENFIGQSMNDTIKGVIPYKIKKVYDPAKVQKFFTIPEKQKHMRMYEARVFNDLADRGMRAMRRARTITYAAGDIYDNTPEYVDRLIDNIKQYTSIVHISIDGQDFDLRTAKHNATLKAFSMLNKDAEGTLERYAIIRMVFEYGKSVLKSKDPKTIKYNAYEHNLLHGFSKDVKLDNTFVNYLIQDPVLTYREAYHASDFFDINSERFTAIEHLPNRPISADYSPIKKLKDIESFRNRHNLSLPGTTALIELYKKVLAIWQLDYMKPTFGAVRLSELKLPPDELLVASEKKGIIRLGSSMGKSMVDYFINMPIEALPKRLFDSLYMVTIAEDLKGNLQSKAFFRDAVNKIQERYGNLQAEGITVDYNPNIRRIRVILDKNSEHAKKYLAQTKEGTFDASEQHVILKPYKESFDIPNKHMEKAYDKLSQEISVLSNGAADGTRYDMVDAEYFGRMRDSIPPHLRELLPTSEELVEAGYFKRGRYNRSALGDTATVRAYNTKVPFNIFKSMLYTLEFSVFQTMETKSKFVQMFLDENNTIHGGIWNGVHEDEIYKMLKENPEYLLAYIIDDPKLGPRVERFDIKNKPYKDYLELYNSNQRPTILNTAQFLEASRAINSMEFSSEALKWWKNNVIGPTKISQLSSPGFIARNIIDSSIKVLSTADSPFAMKYFHKSFLMAVKGYADYKQILRVVYKHTGSFSLKGVQSIYQYVLHSFPLEDLSEEVAELLKTPTVVAALKRLDEDGFLRIHNYLQQGAAMGLSDFERQLRADKWKDALEHGARPEFTATGFVADLPHTKLILNTTSTIENTIRLTNYFMRLMQGDTVSKAQYAVYSAHFDSTVKTKARMILEYVMPFAGFTADNAKFWTDVMNKKGWVVSYMRDALTPIFDFDSYSEDDLNDNLSLQYNLLSGNVIMENNLVFKLSASVLDALKILIDPNEALGRTMFYVNIPIELLVEGTKDVDWGKLIATNIPVIGPYAYRYWGMDTYLQDVLSLGEAFVTGKPATLNGSYQTDTGPAVKGMYRIEGSSMMDTFSRLLVAAVPSLFGGLFEYDKIKSNKSAYSKLKKQYKDTSQTYYRDDLYGGGVERVSLNEALANMKTFADAREAAGYRRYRYVSYRANYAKRKKFWTRKSFVQKIRRGAFSRKTWAAKSYAKGNYVAGPGKFMGVRRPNIIYAKPYYTKRLFATPSYVSNSSRTMTKPKLSIRSAPKSFANKKYTQLGGMNNAGQTPNPARVGGNVLHSTPRNFFYKLYTRRGTQTWAPRMKPTTPTNLRSVIRRDWYYLR